VIATQQKRDSRWYYPLQVDSKKREHVMMFLIIYLEGDFSMAKKGQTFASYSEELKREVARLKSEEGWSYRQLRERFGIKSDAQIADWVKKVKNNELFEDHRGQWNKRHFNSLEEENAYLKAQVEYLKKRNPNLHGKEWS
jgi:transposase